MKTFYTWILAVLINTSVVAQEIKVLSDENIKVLLGNFDKAHQTAAGTTNFQSLFHPSAIIVSDTIDPSTTTWTKACLDPAAYTTQVKEQVEQLNSIKSERHDLKIYLSSDKKRALVEVKVVEESVLQGNTKATRTWNETFTIYADSADAKITSMWIKLPQKR